MQVIYNAGSMQIWCVQSAAPIAPTEAGGSRTIAGFWFCVLCNLYSFIYISLRVWLWTMCIIIRQDWWSSPASWSYLWSSSLSLGPCSCLDWRSTGKVSQGIRPDRELLLAAQSDDMKEVVVADVIYLPWAAKNVWTKKYINGNKWSNKELIIIKWNEKISQFLHYNVLFHL